MTEASWQQGFTVRAPRPDEAQQVADLICACDIADTGEPDWDVEETRADWARLPWCYGVRKKNFEVMTSLSQTEESRSRA